MTDIVERLRQDLKLQHEAADEIDRLRMACRGAGRLLDAIDPKEAGTAGGTIQEALVILDAALSDHLAGAGKMGGADA